LDPSDLFVSARKVTGAERTSLRKKVRNEMTIDLFRVYNLRELQRSEFEGSTPSEKAVNDTSSVEGDLERKKLGAHTITFGCDLCGYR
jgi:hypothetical protein